MKIDSITDKTTVPLFAVFMAVPFIIGAILWLSAVDQKASAANSKLDGLENVKELIFDLIEIVIRIEQHQRDLDSKSRGR
jgi:hypothetical protein